MSEPQMRLANDDENAASAVLGGAIVASLQQFEPQMALTVLTYVAASVALSMEPKPPHTRISAMKAWFEAVVASIEATEAADLKAKH